jgi:hypothetical protein
MTDEQFYRQALGVLQRELGPDRLARFIQLCRSGSGNFTRDRAEHQDGLTIDEIFGSIRINRAS